jgi:hypothetical protein
MNCALKLVNEIGQIYLLQNNLHEREYKHSNIDIINNDNTFKTALKIHNSRILDMDESKFKLTGLAQRRRNETGICRRISGIL